MSVSLTSDAYYSRGDAFLSVHYWTRMVMFPLVAAAGALLGDKLGASLGTGPAIVAALIVAVIAWSLWHSERVSRLFAKVVAFPFGLRVCDYRHRRRRGSRLVSDVGFNVYGRDFGFRYFRGVGLLGLMDSIDYLNDRELAKIRHLGSLREF